MKQFHNNVFVSSAAACVLLAAQPVLAQLTQVTDVKLNPIEGGVSVILKTAVGDRPQVFTTKKDKSLVADVINAQLRLPKGDKFLQENPAPGIASIEVKQLETNSIRVTVTGIDDVPSSQPLMRKDNNITLGFTSTTNSTAANATKPTEKGSAVLATTKPTEKVSAAPATSNLTERVPVAPATTSEYKPNEPGKRPDVLVPNPQVTIDGKIAQSAGPNQPYNQAPPFLPRAVAPPVGDITQSNIDTSPTVIDLGTQERVPRLVLRDAPVREVLSLLARAANLNLAYVGGDDKDPKTPAASSTNKEDIPIYQTISLDIENEPVQDVFNYVLRLSGLQANRSGRTIFVGTKLPNSTRDIVMRNLRLNQAQVKEVASFLVRLGAESALNPQVQTTRVTAQELISASVKEGGGQQGGQQGSQQASQSTTPTEIKAERIKFDDSVPILRGLQVLGDERTNTLTLIGSPRLVEIAIAQIAPLDLRRRQVVVNVKIIDVNLLGIQDTNSSFSFGLGNSFFVSEGGAASFNFGGVNPPSQATVTGSVLSPAVTNAPVPGLFQYPKRFLSSLTAQVQSGNAKILTDPSLIVQEGQSADVQLTQDVVGDITNTITDTPGGSRQERIIKKEKVGLSLAVKIDRIDDNGFVSLSVAPVVKSPAGTADTGNGQVILVATRSLNSGTIRLRDGQTLILSGIIQDQDRTTITKLPILGDIPLIGSLFRKSNRTNERREVIVLLTPQVMDDSERSSYGYNYNPSPQIRQILERRGLKVQPR
ncbi:AMIN domain-containing protein [Dolichospermum sp. ST_con]|nr:AMIN domain-containing protein [Dolichospermum sp. ST_con]